MKMLTVLSIFCVFLCGFFLVGGYTVIMTSSKQAIVVYFLITGFLFILSLIGLIKNMRKECAESQDQTPDIENTQTQEQGNLNDSYQGRFIEEAVLYPQYLPFPVYSRGQEPSAPPLED